MAEKPKDPNCVCTFSLKRNAEKQAGDKRPDFVLVDSEKVNEKSGKPYRKNFTINGVWHEASAYIQKDNSLKVTIKKTASTNSVPKQASAGVELGI